MAVYVEDWSGHDLGSGVPAGWESRWGTSSVAYAIQLDDDAPSGKSLRMVKSSLAPSMLSMDAIPDNTAEIDIRALVRSARGPLGTYGGLMSRARGLPPNEVGTGGFLGSSSGGDITDIRRVTYRGAATHVNTFGAAENSWEAGKLYWIRLITTETESTFLLNAYDDPEGVPLDSVTAVTGSIASAEFLRNGIAAYASSTDMDVLWWGAGTGSDPAPLPEGWEDLDPPQGVVTINDIVPSHNSAAVSYTYNWTDATSFQCRIDEGSPFTVTGNPFSVGGLSDGQDYDSPGIQVRAVNRAGEGPWSDPHPFSTTEVSGIAIHADFERSSVDPTLSEVTVDSDDVLLIKLHARRQTSGTWVNRWIEPVAKITGALGQQPRIEIVPYNNGAHHNGANNQGWMPVMRGHYSYDGKNWTPFDTLQRVDRLRWRNNTPFTQDEVWIARSWPRSVTQVGELIEGLAAAHPDKVVPTPSAGAHTPADVLGFPALDYVFAEVSPKTDELGRPVPHTPLYGFMIDDSSYGEKQSAALITAGIHAGEDVGELFLWEYLEWLLGPSMEASTLRQNYRVYVYPLLNPAGRFAGFWRGAPGSTVDTNREWDIGGTIVHDCVSLARDAVPNDIGLRPVRWSFDIHSTVTGSTMQIGINNTLPLTNIFDTKVRDLYPGGDWSDYGDRKSVPVANPQTITGWQRVSLESKMVMLFETSDQAGPVSPDIIRPYAQAAGTAIYEMHQEGLFWTDTRVPGIRLSLFDGTTPADNISDVQVFLWPTSPPLNEGGFTMAIAAEADIVDGVLEAEFDLAGAQPGEVIGLVGHVALWKQDANDPELSLGWQGQVTIEDISGE